MMDTYTFELYDVSYENIDYTSGYEIYIAETKTNCLTLKIKADSREKAIQRLGDYAKQNKLTQKKAKLINIYLEE